MTSPSFQGSRLSSDVEVPAISAVFKSAKSQSIGSVEAIIFLKKRDREAWALLAVPRTTAGSWRSTPAPTNRGMKDGDAGGFWGEKPGDIHDK